MATLTREVKKFATDKKLEIETLKVREEYRREFLVSHELKTPLFTVQGLSTLLDGAMNDKTIRKKYWNAPKRSRKIDLHVQDLDMISKLEMEI
jgi:two-component system phosphate regulon sensor histidine kinase PhoR